MPIYGCSCECSTDPRKKAEYEQKLKEEYLAEQKDQEQLELQAKQQKIEKDRARKKAKHRKLIIEK